jgi:putative peptidoglycan lipid II flippase
VTDDRGEAVSLRSVGRSALILTTGAAAVQVIQIFREVFIAATVGVSSELDAFLIALVLPTSMSGLLTIGTVTALVPAYIEARDGQGPKEARRLAGGVLFWVGAGGLLLSLVLVAVAGPAISITGPGLDEASHDAAVGYLHIVAPLSFISAVSAIFYAVCQAEERFAVIAWAILIGSIATLATMLILWGPLYLGALAVGSVLGPIVTASILLGSLARNSSVPRLTVRPTDVGIGALVRHAAPLTLSAAIGQLNVISDRAIASLIAPGAVSALRYADVLVRTPVSAIGPAWGSALYPALVRAAHGRAGEGLATATDRSLRYALALFIPLAALTAAVAPVAVSVAYARGAFAPADVASTARVVVAFAPLIVILMTSPVLTGALNARRSGVVLLAGGTLNAVLNFILDVGFGLVLGVAGIALSSSVTSAIVLVFFAQRVARSERTFSVRAIGETTARATLASLPPALVIAGIAWSGVIPSGVLPGLVALTAFGILGLLGYLAIATRLGLEEPQLLLDVGIRQLKLRARLGGSAG